MKITEEDKQSQFLKWIHGDNIPNDIEKDITPNGDIIYVSGKLNTRRLIKKTLELLKV